MVMSSKSVHAANREISEGWDLLQKNRGILRSMLDGTADETSVIKQAEDLTAKLKSRVEYSLRERSFFVSKINYIIKRKEDSSLPLKRRAALSLKISEMNEVFESTSSSLSQSSLGFVFKRSNSSSTSLPTSLGDPCFSWTLEFKQMHISDVRDVWQGMRYDEKEMLEWWWNGPGIEQSTSDGWSDFKRLARRVVFKVLEELKSEKVSSSRHFLHLKLVAEMLREIILYQVTACYKFLGEWIKFKDLLEHTIPITYLVSDIFSSAQYRGLTALQNDKIEDNLTMIEPYLRKLRGRCYLLGHELDFDASKFFSSDEETTGSSKLFNFEHNLHESSNQLVQLTEVAVDSRLAGDSAEDYMRRVDQMGQKQSIVNRIVENPQSCQHSELNKILPVSTERLDVSVLLERGVKELTDIEHEGYNHIGSGAHADVLAMNQVIYTTRTSVAVKRFRPDTRSAKRIEREASVWSKLKHKHIVPLLGFIVIEHLSYQPCLVSRLCYTDMKRFLKMRREAAQVDPSQGLTEDRKFKFLRDIILGLDYLHALGIAHGDLRAANILITNGMLNDESCYAILNDFGMAEYAVPEVQNAIDYTDLSSVNQKTHERWLAPELFESPPRAKSKAKVSLKGDVYAFGVVYLEIMYERDPYVDTRLEIGFAKSQGELPVTKEQLHPPSEAHWSIMSGCWEKEEDKRWTMPMAGAMVLTLMFKNVAAQSDEECVSDDLSGLPEGFTQYTM